MYDCSAAIAFANCRLTTASTTMPGIVGCSVPCAPSITESPMPITPCGIAGGGAVGAAVVGVVGAVGSRVVTVTPATVVAVVVVVDDD